MVELMNWPPSRGENPCTCKSRLALGELRREDFEQPPSLRSDTEQQVLDGLVGDLREKIEDAIDTDDDFVDDFVPPKRYVRQPIANTNWSCDYYVEDVAELTLEQAVDLLCVGPARHSEEPDEDLLPDEAELEKFKTFCEEALTHFPAIAKVGRAAANAQDHARAALLAAYAFARFGIEGASRLETHDRWHGFEPRELVVEIDYPLEKSVRLHVPPMQRSFPSCSYCVETAEKHDGETRERLEMSPGYLLWVVAKEYTRIYREYEHYGIWGHAIGDLVFEDLSIDEHGVVHLGIGS